MSKSNKRQRIKDEDWNILFPGKEIMIGTTPITIKPLSVDQFTTVLRRITTHQGRIVERFKKEKINLTNFDSPENKLKLVSMIMDIVPEALADAANIDVDDTKRLPFHKALEILEAVLDVNIESQEGLVKNLKSLAEKMTSLMATAA